MAKGRRVLYIGDSITDGAWGNAGVWNATSDQRSQTDMNHIYGHGYMWECASHYESENPTAGYQFWNRGISGNTLRDIHNRWQKDALNLKPEVISILVGTNDSDQFLYTGKTDFDFASWEKEYRHLLDTTQTVLPDVKFVLCTPFVAKVGERGQNPNYALRESIVKKLAEITKTIAKDYKARLVPFDELVAELVADTATADNYWIWDGIHPTPACHQRMAKLWEDKAGDLVNNPTAKKEVIHLWADQKAPTSNGIKEKELDHDGLFVEFVTDPVLTVYVPEHPNGTAVLACPGGSYLQVWQGSEGHNLAQWYNDQGITYAVLKYRLPNGHKEVPMDDVHRAMKIMKEHQSEYGFTRLGIQGCSAGGHLASTAATHYANKDERFDFQILFYPVISFDPSFTHMLTREDLIGKNASTADVELYSNEKQVTSDTPQAFIMASTDDGLVPVRNSVEYYNALVKNGVSATMHLYPTGGHGWCGHEGFEYRQQWMNELKLWLSKLK